MSEERKRVTNWKIIAGVVLLLLGLTALLLTFWSVISVYISHVLSPTPSTSVVEIAKNSSEITKEVDSQTEKVFVDPEFGLYIPKLKTNCSIAENVDPFDKDRYTSALRSKIAHAKGTSVPNKSGNVFLFGHSAANFYERHDRLVYFYLLRELSKGDEIFLSYKGVIYKYVVDELKTVSPEDTKYLKNYSEKDTLTLMTCYPPGADWKRTVVIAYRDEVEPIVKGL
ncbi:MAG: sortase [Candidatus Dojkabacteria bacterium]